MSEEFSFNNIAETIRRLQEEGWRITEMGEKRFEFKTPSSEEDCGMNYGRPYDDPDELVSMKTYSEDNPDIDVQAEYYARLYLMHWKNTSSREVL